MLKYRQHIAEISPLSRVPIPKRAKVRCAQIGRQQGPKPRDKSADRIDQSQGPKPGKENMRWQRRQCNTKQIVRSDVTRGIGVMPFQQNRPITRTLARGKNHAQRSRTVGRPHGPKPKTRGNEGGWASSKIGRSHGPKSGATRIGRLDGPIHTTTSRQRSTQLYAHNFPTFHASLRVRSSLRFVTVLAKNTILQGADGIILCQVLGYFLCDFWNLRKMCF